MKSENIGFWAGVLIGLFAFVVILLTGLLVGSVTGIVAREVPPHIGVAFVIVWSVVARSFAKAMVEKSNQSDA